jgi:cell wall-associated NlpC family hydrolase
MDSFFKKGFSLGLVLACTFAASNTAFAATKGTINADNVNIRTQASTSSDVMKMLSKGVTVTVTDNVDGWYKLSTATGGVAYVKQDFVTITQADAVVTDSFINVRSNPSITADVIGVVNQGQVVTVTGAENEDWYTVSYNGQKGYVYGEYVSGDMISYLNGVTAKAKPADKVQAAPVQAPAVTAGETAENDIYAVITSTSLNLREKPSTDSDVIFCYDNGYTFDIVGVADGGWLKVMDDNGQTGYVKADYVSLKNGVKPENAPVVIPDKADKEDMPVKPAKAEPVMPRDDVPASEEAEEIIAYAKQFIGTPYVYGGTNLTAGVDCSGFTYSVYRDFGITLERCSRDQIKNGTNVEKEDLQPGDLIFFNTGGESQISHVGMYIGNGEYIHSTDGAAQGVTISDLGSDYALRTYVGATRILGNETPAFNAQAEAQDSES